MLRVVVRLRTYSGRGEGVLRINVLRSVGARGKHEP